MKDFDTEIRNSPDSQYVKVFIKNQAEIGVVKSLLEKLDSIRRINYTTSHSGGIETITLTVYPRRMYNAEEVQQDIKNFLLGVNIDSPILNQVEKETTMNNLDCCPEAKKLYEQALLKFNNANFERNVLDDLRLCLELFLKCKLGNDKQLENQMPEIGKYQKEKGCSKEFVNMFHAMFDYYTKYQNEHVKHNDKVNPQEMNFVFKLTIDFINNF